MWKRLWINNIAIGIATNYNGLVRKKHWGKDKDMNKVDKEKFVKELMGDTVFLKVMDSIFDIEDGAPDITEESTGMILAHCANLINLHERHSEEDGGEAAYSYMQVIESQYGKFGALFISVLADDIIAIVNMAKELDKSDFTIALTARRKGLI